MSKHKLDIDESSQLWKKRYFEAQSICHLLRSQLGMYSERTMRVIVQGVCPGCFTKDCCCNNDARYCLECCEPIFECDGYGSDFSCEARKERKQFTTKFCSNLFLPELSRIVILYIYFPIHK